MNGYRCMHGIGDDEFCPHCEASGSASHTYSPIPGEDEDWGDVWEGAEEAEPDYYQYQGGRRWCEDEYVQYIELTRNAA